MSSEKQNDHKDTTTGGREGKKHKEPRARGTPGSFDQPTPREEFMPRQGGRPTWQTAEVPLGTGDVPEPPGGGGLPSRRGPNLRGWTPADPDAPEALQSRGKADEKRTERRDPEGEAK